MYTIRSISVPHRNWPAVGLLVPRSPAQNEVPSLSAWFLCLYQNIPKAQQPKNLQGWQRSGELGRMKLGDVKPLLDRLSLRPTVMFEQCGKVADRQLTLFLAYDFHSIRGVASTLLPAPGFVKRERAAV